MPQSEQDKSRAWHHLSPGQGFHKAYQATLSGNRKGVKALIRSSNYWEKDYRTYADTLRNILSDSTIFINGIQYDHMNGLLTILTALASSSQLILGKTALSASQTIKE